MPRFESTILCTVCSLPSVVDVCSERCRKLRPLKQKVAKVAGLVDQQICEAVNALQPPATYCPGKLAFSVLAQLGVAVSQERDALALLRSHLRKLREQRRLRFFQKGTCVPIGKWPQGAFRVGK